MDLSIWHTTYNLGKDLPDNLDQLVINELAAFQARLLQSSNLLLDYDLESGCADEQTRSGTLSYLR